MTAADVLTGDGLKVTQDAIALCCMLRPSSTWDWFNESPSAKDILLLLEGWFKVNHLSYSTSLSIYNYTTGSSPHIFGGNGSTGDRNISSTAR
jgi:hypothetical protein